MPCRPFFFFFLLLSAGASAAAIEAANCSNLAVRSTLLSATSDCNCDHQNPTKQVTETVSFFAIFFSWSNKTKTATHVEGQFQIGVAAAGRALGRRHQLIEEAAQRNLVALLVAAKTKKNSVNENWVTFRFDQHELRKNHKQLIKKSVEFRRFSLAKKKTLG